MTNLAKNSPKAVPSTLDGPSRFLSNVSFSWSSSFLPFYFLSLYTEVCCGPRSQILRRIHFQDSFLSTSARGSEWLLSRNSPNEDVLLIAVRCRYVINGSREFLSRQFSRAETLDQRWKAKALQHQELVLQEIQSRSHNSKAHPEHLRHLNFPRSPSSPIWGCQTTLKSYATLLSYLESCSRRTSE